MIALDGALQLFIDGHDFALPPHEPFAFRGESTVRAVVRSGPAHDLNVMTRRAEFAHDVEIVTKREVFLVDDDELVFAYVIAGEARVAGASCATGETVYLDGEERFEVEPAPNGSVCVTRITPR